MHDSRAFRKNVWYLLGATRGGGSRARIMHALLQRPMNANQLASRLGMDYKTIVHHLSVLQKHHWIVRDERTYGDLAHPAFTEEQEKIFSSIWDQIGKNL